MGYWESAAVQGGTCFRMGSARVLARYVAMQMGYRLLLSRNDRFCAILRMLAYRDGGNAGSGAIFDSWRIAIIQRPLCLTNVQS